MGVAAVFMAILFLLMAPHLMVADLPLYTAREVFANSAAPQPGALREDAISILITRDGRVFFRGQEIDTQQLPASIWESIRGGSEIRVYLYVDLRTKMYDVNKVVEGIHRAGIRDLVLMAGYQIIRR